MEIIKKFTPRPEDGEGNSMGKIDLSSFVLEAAAESLNDMDQSSVIKLFVTLLESYERKVDLLIDNLVEKKGL